MRVCGRVSLWWHVLYGGGEQTTGCSAKPPTRARHATHPLYTPHTHLPSPPLPSSSLLPRAPQVISTSGDTHLGGEDFDQRVMEYFIKLVKRKFKKDVSTDARALQVGRRWWRWWWWQAGHARCACRGCARVGRWLASRC